MSAAGNSITEQKRKITPPIYLALTIGLMVLLDRFLPLVEWVSEPASFLGRPILITGVLVILWPFVSFTRAGTGLVPFSKATALVTSGLYRVTRNPMYLGMVLILLGGAVRLGSLGALIPIPLFIWVIQGNFIMGEERFLEETFGDDYLEYKKKVRRWL